MKTKENFLIQEFGDRKICIKGVGKLFYQDGFPISLAIDKFKDSDIEVSILHVADECLKNGWSADTTYKKLKEDSEDNKESKYNLEELRTFCYADYETQRSMMFKYLFKTEQDLKEWIVKYM